MLSSDDPPPDWDLQTPFERFCNGGPHNGSAVWELIIRARPQDETTADETPPTAPSPATAGPANPQDTRKLLGAYTEYHKTRVNNALEVIKAKLKP